MTYVILDDQFHSNPKINDVGLPGAGLYAMSLSYCGSELTDGFVPASWARKQAPKRLLDKLVDHRLWRPVKPGDTFQVPTKDGSATIRIPSEGFYIDDYLELNPSREAITDRREELRRIRSAAGRNGARNRWHTDSKPDSKTMANAWQNDGPQPQPQPQQDLGLLADAVNQLARTRPPAQTAPNTNPIDRLLNVLTDQDQRTKRTITKLVRDNALTEGDLEWARECATGPGVNSPSSVAVAELKKRAAQRRTPQHAEDAA